MEDKRRYIIVGPAASGKDWLQKRFVEKGYRQLIQYTTRPQRPTENGDEYHFISQKLMGRMIMDMKFLSVKNFNTWWYGFVKKDFEECDVAILSIGNINDLKENDRKLYDSCEIIYLNIPNDVRIKRLKGRYVGGNEDDSIERRVSADERDFEYFNNYTICLTSENEVVNYINKIQEK